MEPSEEDFTIDAFEIFIKVMGFGDWDELDFGIQWNSSAEFVMFLGFGAMVATKASVARANKLCNSPNAEIIVKAYKARRYSFVGRVRSVFIKPAVALALLSWAFADIVLDWAESGWWRRWLWR